VDGAQCDYLPWQIWKKTLSCFLGGMGWLFFSLPLSKASKQVVMGFCFPKLVNLIGLVFFFSQILAECQIGAFCNIFSFLSINLLSIGNLRFILNSLTWFHFKHFFLTWPFMVKLFVFLHLAMNHFDWPNTYKIQTRPQEKLCKLPNIHRFILKYEFLYPLPTKEQVPTSIRTIVGK